VADRVAQMVVKVAQMVVKQVLEPILDPIFLADSYGYVSEAVKKCTTMAGGVAPPEWLGHGWPQTQ
jgi:hypothetical protein